MKLIDSIHEASQDSRKAQEIASKSSIALVIDAVILVALFFGALWFFKSVEAVLTGEDTTAVEIFVILLFIIVIGGGLWILVRTILHAIPVCIWAINQMKEIFGLDKANPKRRCSLSVLNNTALTSSPISLHNA